MKAILIYLTCGSREEAEAIGSHLVEQKLVACANIMPPHHSIYSWDGKVERSEEVVVVLKTQSTLFEKVREEIVSKHSYDCPCIVALPIAAGHEPFLNWIEAQTV